MIEPHPDYVDRVIVDQVIIGRDRLARRPTSAESAAIAHELLARGMTHNAVCRRLGTHADRLHALLADYPERTTRSWPP